VQAVLQAPELTLLGAAPRRRPQFDNVNFCLRVNAPKRLIALNAAALHQAADLDQNGILHLNGLVERPAIAEHAADTARQQDHCG